MLLSAPSRAPRSRQRFPSKDAMRADAPFRQSAADTGSDSLQCPSLSPHARDWHTELLTSMRAECFVQALAENLSRASPPPPISVPSSARVLSRAPRPLLPLRARWRRSEQSRRSDGRFISSEPIKSSVSVMHSAEFPAMAGFSLSLCPRQRPSSQTSDERPTS